MAAAPGPGSSSAGFRTLAAAAAPLGAQGTWDPPTRPDPPAAPPAGSGAGSCCLLPGAPAAAPISPFVPAAAAAAAPCRAPAAAAAAAAAALCVCRAPTPRSRLSPSPPYAAQRP